MVLLSALLGGLFVSCTIRPKEVLSRREMTEVLYDLHRMEGCLQAAGYNYGNDAEVALYYQAVLDKHGITQAQFDSSLVWYTDNPKRFVVIYPKVVERLQKERDDYFASVPSKGQLAGGVLQKAMPKVDLDSLLNVMQTGFPMLWQVPENRIKTGAAFRYIAFPEFQDSLQLVLDTTKRDSLVLLDTPQETVTVAPTDPKPALGRPKSLLAPKEANLRRLKVEPE